ncbi:MAG: hypothetical protein V4671_14260, partial [Armatimonadota bacterium]
MNQTARRDFLICGLLIAAALIGGCGGGAATTASSDLMGTWRLAKITGGFSGGGFPLDTATETLTFEQNGTGT